MPESLLILFGYLVLFKLNEPSIISICIGVAFVLIGVVLLSRSLSFKDLTIYKDKVIFNRYFFHNVVIDVDNIDSVHYKVGGYTAFVYMCIYTKISLNGYTITALRDSDMYRIQEIIQNLKEDNPC
jgi:hypothetical protein